MFNFFDKSDTQIQHDVVHELKWDPSVSSSQITVSTRDGIVTLRGSVPHYNEKITAEDAAQRVSGVRAVADEIEVNLMGSYERTDEDIARVALDTLEWNYSVPRHLKVTVEKGWITLKGEAEWDYQRVAANNAVKSLMGVRGVTNSIALKSTIHLSDVKARIEEALKRSVDRETSKISVTVRGSIVTLTGYVHSFGEIADAGLAAWNAPGVTAVENNLKMSH